MSCNIPPEILEYIEQVENNAPRACKEQHALVALIRRVFATEDIYYLLFLKNLSDFEKSYKEVKWVIIEADRDIIKSIENNLLDDVTFDMLVEDDDIEASKILLDIKNN